MSRPVTVSAFSPLDRNVRRHAHNAESDSSPTANTAECPSRKAGLSTFPDGLRGNGSVRISHCDGTLNDAIVSAAKAVSSSAVDRRSRRHHDHCFDLLAEVLVRHADHRHIHDSRVLVQAALDLHAVDVLAATDDDVLRSIGDVEEAVLVEVADIARPEEPVHEDVWRSRRDAGSSRR